MDFQWDDENLDHIAIHGVEWYEAEDALLKPKSLKFGAHPAPNGEPRDGVLSKTEQGRLLVIIFTIRNGFLRIVTAREANASEKKSFKRRST